MSEIPGQLKFTRDHEWVREHDDGTVEVGITDHAQTALGDLVFIELPDTGGSFTAQMLAVLWSLLKQLLTSIVLWQERS